MLHVYLPEEWTALQSRLIKNHPEIWKAINSLDKNDAIYYLNTLLGTTVPTDALLKDAGRIFMDALLKREGAIILLDGSVHSGSAKRKG